MDDHSTVLKTMSQLMAANAAPVQASGHTYALVPEHFKYVPLDDNIEKMQAEPRRARGKIAMHDLGSFIAFTVRFARPGSTAVYVDRDAYRFTAIINDHSPDRPGWRDHGACYEAKMTPEFKRWRDQSGKPMNQVEFAEFIEDNIKDLAVNDQALLDVATTLSANTATEWSSARRLDNGQVQLVYKESIEARAGASGSIDIPRVFQLGLRIFENGTAYAIRARFKYRLAQGNVKMWFELDRVDDCIKDAFKDYVTALNTALADKCPVYLGQPG